MTYELVGGPQDGAKVVIQTEVPECIYVQREWQGDGYATFGLERSERFHCKYDFMGGWFQYLI